MSFELYHRNIGVVVVVKRMVDTGHMFYIVKYFCYVVADNDDGTVLVYLVQHFIHLSLKPLVDVGVGFVQHDDIGMGNDGPGQQNTLQLAAAERTDVTVLEIFQFHLSECLFHLCVLL